MDQKNILEDIKVDIRKNLEVILSLDCSGPTAKTRRGLQHMMSKKYSDCAKRALYESIMNFSVRSEITCPGSGILFLKLLTGDLKNYHIDIVRNKKEIVDILKSRKFELKVLHLLVESLTHVTNTTRLSIKKSYNQKSYIEVVEGFNFKVKPLLKDSLTECLDVSVLCIDGFIESVSEIHHVLSFLAEKKEHCLIFSRGMSQEVLHTIKVNNDRGIFFIIPLVIPFDPENVNTIVDIAVVSGTDVVSTTKGNLISSIDLNCLGKVESCVQISDSLRIKNTLTRTSVKTHRSMLRNLLEERPELEDIISSRIRSMTSSCIDICIPDDISFYSTSQQIDEGIRIISSIVNNTYSPLAVAEKFLNSYIRTFENTEVFTLEQRCLL